MKLYCKRISINDGGLGCQVAFYEKKDLGEETVNMSFNEIIESKGRYLLLQRSFPDDDYESDYIYFETHDDKHSGELVGYEIVLSKSCFELKLKNEKIEVMINPTEKEYSGLKDILSILTNNNGKLIINDWQAVVTGTQYSKKRWSA